MNSVMGLTDIVVLAVPFLVLLLTLGLIFSKLYTRASKEIAFVKTGMGGQKVVMNGGMIVLPVLHEIIPVNMNTQRLEVVRANEQALITKDRMRVDVTVEFYVRVKPTEEAVADAAQTLGRKTMNPTELKHLVEGKFVDALRAVAAEMSMEELHEQRVGFVNGVQRAVAEDLLKNGLELETVSLTSLDQTSREYFNPDNAFDAQGLTKLTEEIEARRKQRNDIEQDTEVAVRLKNLEATRQKLELSKEEEYATLEQQREVENRRSAQLADIARERAQQQQAAEQAEIMAKQQVETSRIDADREVQERRIEMERQLRERDINKAKAVETADVERLKTVELAKQDQAIAIAEKSKAQSEMQAQADKARALAVKAEEEVVTVRERERAERQKQIELVEAAKLAERDAISITVAAQAEKRAAEDKAEAVKTLATADAEKVRIAAEGDAEAEKLRADAAEKRYSVEAEGLRARHEADNLLSAEQIAMQIRLAIIQNLAEIIRQSVKPMESIEGIKILQLEGLNGLHGGNGHGAGGAGQGANGNLADEVVSSALRYRAQAPLVDSLLSELGFGSGSLTDLTAALHQSVAPVAAVNGSADKVRPEKEQSR
ncbi:MAG: hypothetical protein KDD69_06005 [Bdellovibrionales bacterium]|nr:hypothetical protein [Bdellovibrionales bacterium]